MKRGLISFCLMFSLLIVMLPQIAAAKEKEAGQDYYDDGICRYEFHMEYGTTAVVFEALTDETDVTIPETLEIEGKSFQVIAVAEDAFQNRKSLRSIHLPSGLRYIMSNAFRGCTALKDVEMPSSVLRIDSGAFQGCTALEFFEIPDAVQSLSQNVFRDCTSLSRVNASKSVCVFEADPFANCPKLTVYAAAGSEMQSYCLRNNIPFHLLVDEGSPFSDLHYYWGKDVVNWAWQNQLVYGITPYSFGPNHSVTRAMMVTFLYRLAGEPLVSGSSRFPDVKANSYYAKAVIWAESNGIVVGDENGRFLPNELVSRPAAAMMFFQYAKLLEKDSPRGDLTQFDDFRDLPGWAEEALSWAVGAGVMSGIPQQDRLDLIGTHLTTRGEAVSMLYRFAML